MKRENIFWQIGRQAVCFALASVTAIAALPAMPAAAGTNGAQAGAGEAQLEKAGCLNVTENTKTFGQPFPEWTAGSQSFRIPCLISIERGEYKGNLVAAADARYCTPGDGGGLDTIASVSTDMGKTWSYSFPIWFPDSHLYASLYATTAIDPALIEGSDGTIYCLADVNPTGITTHYGGIGAGTGYVSVHGKQYLALTDTYSNAGTNPAADANGAKYPYYVGDFDGGYAPVLKRSDSSATDWRVDRWFNIEKKQTDGTFAPLRQKQVNTDADIQQNAFYAASELHVYNIGYIWMVESKDGGQSWENPRILNDQIKDTDEGAILVSPGKGLTTKGGLVTLPLYGRAGTARASFMYSKDNGKTWKRTNDVDHTTVSGANMSTESEMVELSDGTLRMFSRNKANKICYTDAIFANGEYSLGSMVSTNVASWSDCNVTAIRYSKKIDDKDLVFVSCPSGSNRTNGKIYAFLVNNEDKTMTLYGEFDIDSSAYKDGYAYSCLVEQQDGTLGLLWEPNTGNYIGTSPHQILYDSFSILEVVPGAPFTDVGLDVELSGNEAYSRSYTGAGTVTEEPDEDVASVTAEKNGSIVTVRIAKGTKTGTAKAVVDGVTYNISVTNGEKKIALEEGQSFTFTGASAQLTDGEDYAALEASDKYYLCNAKTDTAVNEWAALDNALLEFAEGKTAGSWHIKSNYINHYLVNSGEKDSTGSYEKYKVFYFDPIPEDMVAEPVTAGGKTAFRIKNKKTGGYVVYDTAGSGSFDYKASYEAAWTDGTYNFLLLKKKETIAAGDFIPGYERVAEIASGEKYLIAADYGGNKVVLYPYSQDKPSWNAVNNIWNASKVIRAKYFKPEIAPVKQWTFTGWNAGETVIAEAGGTRYQFEIQEPVSQEASENALLHLRDSVQKFLSSETEENYTKATWDGLANACAKAQEAQPGMSATEAQGLRTNLLQAKENLSAIDKEQEKAAAQRDLENALGDFTNGANLYTGETYEKFRNAYTELRNALANPASVSARKLLELHQAFTTARSALISKPPVGPSDTGSGTGNNTENGTGNNAGNSGGNGTNPGGFGADNTAGKVTQSTEYKDENCVYRVIDPSNKTIEVSSLGNASSKKISIDKTVTIGGEAYMVTAIAADAFKGNKTVTDITVKADITSIGSGAFSGCTSLKKITISSTKLKEIKNKAFFGCTNLKSITLKTKSLAKIEKKAFEKVRKGFFIKVPANKVSAYKKRFKGIRWVK